MYIDFLGDTHLGKTFRNGVPLHRRGEREELIWQEFVNKLNESRRNTLVHVGDVFDTPYPSFSLLLKVAEAYENANHYRHIIIAGNHDMTKTSAEGTGIHMLQRLLETTDHVMVLTKPAELDGVAYFPYSPVVPTYEVVEEFLSSLSVVPNAVVGHWDVDERSDPHNLIPTAVLRKFGVIEAYTGHDHKPRCFSRDGVCINVIGSMQPYAHGEEETPDMYLTIPYADLDPDRSVYKDKCLRIVLGKDEHLEETIDCLQLTTVREKADDEVSLDEISDDFVFDIDELLIKALHNVGIEDKETITLVRDKFNELDQ